MPTKPILAAFALAMCVGLLSACGPWAAPAATPTAATPTRTPRPSRTLQPTYTRPTSTPSLTRTATPVPQVSIGPGLDLDRFQPASSFQVEFLESMDPASSTNPIMTFPYVAGTYSWNETNKRLTFVPAAALSAGQVYTFFVDPALRTSLGALLDRGYEWRVRADPGPEIESISPPDGQLTQRSPTIRISFDRPMDQDLTGRSFSIQPALEYELDWPDDHTLQAKVLSPFWPGTRYDFRLAGSASSPSTTDAAGNPRVDDYVWSYWAPPFRVSVSATGPSTVEVDFNYSLDQAATGQTFAIQPELSGTWSWVSNRKARFEAAAPILLAQEYTLTVSASLRDADGLLQQVPAAYPFTAFPPVEIDLPKPRGDYGLPPSYALDLSPIPFVFSIPVDHASVEAAFRFSPELPGEFVWEAGSDDGEAEILKFLPSRLLEPATTYTVTILPSARSADGKPILVKPYSSTFATYYWWYSYGLPAFFGEGSNVQVTDSQGARKVQFGAGNNVEVRFDLYGYSLSDFVRLYANDHGARRDWPESFLLPVPAEAQAPAASWEYTAPRDQVVDETDLPAEVSPGLYVLNLSTDGRLYDQLFLILTRNTLVLKSSAQELFVWMRDIQGKPVPYAEMRVYSEEGAILYEGRTNLDGVWSTGIQEGEEPMLVTGRINTGAGYDVTASGLDGSWHTIPSYTSSNWMDWWRHSGGGSRYRVHTTTDRPIYLPGQTVNYSVIVRRDQDVRFSLLPGGTPVTVRLQDTRQNLLETVELRTDGYGCVNGAFVLSEGVMLGDYTIQVLVGQETHTQDFKVQEYRKPDLVIDVLPGDPGRGGRYVVGESIALRIDARYFFGEPLSGSEFSTRLYARYGDYYYWESYAGFDPDPYAGWTPTKSLTVESPGRLGEDGQAELTLLPKAIGQEEAAHDWYSSAIFAKYALEVTIDDGSGQPVTGVYVFEVFEAGEQIILDNGGYFQQPEQPFTVRGTVKDLDGEPVAGRQLTLSVHAWDRSDFEFGESQSGYTLETDASGQVRQEILLPSGYYQLKLAGQDARGNAMADTNSVYVFSSPDDWWNRTQERISIRADRISYGPNETAVLAIESAFSGPALLTFERGRVIESLPVELTAPLTIVETRILPQFAPNVFITINGYQPSQEIEHDEYDWEYWGSNRPDAYLRTDSVEVLVDASQQALQVGISTDQESYAPGEAMRVTLDVRDARGSPVAAQVSLAVVDEAIFSLSEEMVPEIFSSFYGPRGRSVGTYDSMSPDRIITEPGGRGSGGGGPARSGGVRSDFKDTAAWFPALLTGSDGRVTVTVQLPDNLTSWRLTARAVTLNTQVGQQAANVEVRQDLLVRPVLPRSLTAGDRAELRALVHNYSEEARSVDVSFSATGLQVEGEAARTVTVEAGQVLPVVWPVTALAAGETQVTVSALAGDGAADTVLLPLTVRPAIIPDRRARSGELKGSLSLPISVPPGSLEGGQVSLELHRSARTSILSGIEYLTGYPYGCIEQTMSRALPNAVVGRLGSLLGDPALQARTAPLIRASIHRLYGFQHDDGGWGWWFDDSSDSYQTAWVLFGLAQIGEAGFDVDPAVIQRGASFLDRQLDEMDVRTRAYTLYSLALNEEGQAASAQALADESLNELDPFSQAALAMALHRLERPDQARLILDVLEAHALQVGNQVYWPQAARDGEYYRKTMSSTLRATAMVLQAFLTIEPDSRLIPGMARYVLSRRQGSWGWGTTNETTFAVLALTDYTVLLERNAGTSPYRVLLDGEQVSSGSLGYNRSSVTIDLPVDRMGQGQHQLTVISSGSTALFYNLVEEYDRPGELFPPTGRIHVTRAYYDQETGDRLAGIELGQLVRIELTVRLESPASFVLLEDHLPGGLEALNERLNTSPIGLSASSDSYIEFFWEDLGYNFKQVLTDRVTFFITQLEAGSHGFDYVARAVLPGTFLALPPEASAMYDPAAWGRGETTQITVQRP